MSTHIAICPTCGYQHDTTAKEAKQLHAEWDASIKSDHATPASIGQGAGTEWARNAALTIVAFLDGNRDKLGCGCYDHVENIILSHSPHPLAGWELREVACFCEGVFSIIEAAPTSFSMGGVKEARRRIAAALTKGPVSP